MTFFLFKNPTKNRYQKNYYNINQLKKNDLKQLLLILCYDYGSSQNEIIEPPSTTIFNTKIHTY